MGIQIELTDNPEAVYYPGQTVKGFVIICNSKPIKAKEVTVVLEGGGQVNFKEKESSVDLAKQTVSVPIKGVPVPLPVPSVATKTVDCSAEETYVSGRITLVGDGENFTILPEGTHNYPFCFDLPNILPSSFTSHVGKVSYILRAEAKRPLFKFNDKASRPITVKGVFDLNLQPSVTLTQKCRKVREPSLFVLRTGELSFILNMPDRSGYVPGEILNFQAEITNNSNKNIKQVTASLQRITKFHAHGKTKTIQESVAEVRGPEVRQKETEIWIPGNLCVPDVVPTKLGGGCGIIDVQYCLHLEMIIFGFTSSLSGELPVLIGTVPLGSTYLGGDNHYENVSLAPMSEKNEGYYPTNYPQVGLPPNDPQYSGFVDPYPPSYAETVEKNR